MAMYYRLPGPARSIAASAVGLYLRQWRYGTGTDHIVSRVLERDRWSPDRWKAYQEQRLSLVLHRAATQVPFYRDAWARRRRNGDRASWAYLENWPVLEKDQVRAKPEAFVADDRPRHWMFGEHTSGTTGKPVQLWWSRATVREWYAMNEARCRRWYGISRKDRWAIIGGKLVVPVQQTKPPFWVWNSGLRQLYMSAYHLAPELALSYLDALRDYRITYLFGYSSGLHALAQAALRSGRRDLRLAVAISNAEPLLEHQRRAIADAFRCPVRETYGMAELVTGASECERGSLHLWPDVGVVELLHGHEPAPVGTIGELVCTGLLNSDMPLIRYRLGDSARLSTAKCPCDRMLPVLQCVEGRSDDLVVTEDGRQVGRLDPVFKGGLPILEAQIVQESVTRFRIRYVPASDFSPAVEDKLRERLQDRVGPVEVSFESMARVPREAFGKFRAVVSHVAPGAKPALTS
jgi:phenylacetate-CoA ligase